MLTRIVLPAILPFLLCSCNLFYSTKVSFLNSTASYTFTEIKLGPLDYPAPLAPGQAIGYAEIDPGTYTLSTKGIDGTWFQWPVPQAVERGYSYTLTFVTVNNTIQYQVYVAMVQ